MRRLARHRLTTVLALGCAALAANPAFGFRAQEESPAAVLLSRARTLEQRGRLDLAKQDWTQVLLIEPNDAEALAGLVRATRAEGKAGEAAGYLSRLRAAHPHDPEIARLEASEKNHDVAEELDEAGKLARSGDPRAAMVLYRRVYGLNPPPGAPALAYYQTEAAIEEDRPHAIAGLRALADRFPEDARYQITLGNVLLASPRTRAEGRTLLERFPDHPEVVAALQQSAAAPAHTTGQQASVGGVTGHLQSPKPKAVPPQGTETANNEASTRTAYVHRAAAAVPSSSRRDAYVADEQAAFNALNEHHQAEAEQRFREILAKDPASPRALAGMGYLHVAGGDLKGAIDYFERAQENGDHSLALTRALVNTEFDLTLQQAAAARAQGDLPGADGQYRAALRERPNDPGAIEGLGGVLLQEGHADQAIPFFSRLTQIRPMDPGAWRGLIVAEVRGGQGSAALGTDARIPPEAKSPLKNDTAYLEALTAARQMSGTQVAKVEPPAPLPATAGGNAPRPVVAPPTATPRTVPATPTAPVGTAASVRVPPRPAAAPNGAARPANAQPSRSAEPPPAGKSEVVTASEPASGSARPEEAIATERVQQAEAMLLRGDNSGAAPLFREALVRQPDRTDAVKGLVLALYRSGKAADALTVLHGTRGDLLVRLQRDATFDATAGSVYLQVGQPAEALAFFARAQEVFSSQRLQPPADLVLQVARLLGTRGDDENLYRELMYLGERPDLSDTQRRQVQMIWTEWAVRRARSLAAAGDERHAVTVLNAAAEAFAGNGEVLRTVATGYAGVGRAKEAVALLKAQDLSQAPARDLEAAVGAAIAAHDFKAGEAWLRLGLARFGNDPEMLTVEAEFEQARGHEKRAVRLSQQAKALAPPENPGQVLTTEMRESRAGAEALRRTGGQLTVLLMPAEAAALANGGQGGRPFLPVSAEATASRTGTQPAEPPVLSSYQEPSR